LPLEAVHLPENADVMPLVSRFVSTIVLFALLCAPSVALRAQREAVEAQRGLVASAHALASEAGVEMLRQGGNAVDAAVATGLALSVVYPFAGNIGGGGFMLIHLADGRDVIIDYRETAPASASRDMYLDANGKLIAGAGSSTVGWRASGVPGTIAGFALALEKYGSGRLTWAQVCEPARRLAAEGHVVSQATARSLRAWEELLAPFAASKTIYLNDGRYHAAGDTWIQADLGATFARLQQHGPREFYTGETARRLADAMTQHGGTITLADLAAYAPVERTPLRGRYRGHDIVTMPPPSSGGIALLQMFAMLEPFDVAALGHNSAAKYHLFAEVMKRAFRDRAEYLGDPAFVDVPVAQLLAPDYLVRRMADFSPERATPASAVLPGLGKFQARSPATTPRAEKMETTHFSVVDAAGNAVANTYTLNGAYGSGVTIPGTGILMNNEMDDFTAKVGAPNMFGLIQGEANAIVPGKRPLSSMTPTMVFKDGKLLLITGSPGGPTIINTVLQIITNVIDHRMPVMQAVEAPRIHNQWMPDVVTYERFGMSPDTMAALKAKGHTLPERKSYEGAYQGDGETIAVDPATGRFFGAADPRKGDAKAVGY
jgi:gamma-glutamyltranspeptidase/glutathione hydrolase